MLCKVCKNKAEKQYCTIRMGYQKANDRSIYQRCTVLQREGLMHLLLLGPKQQIKTYKKGFYARENA